MENSFKVMIIVNGVINEYNLFHEPLVDKVFILPNIGRIKLTKVKKMDSYTIDNTTFSNYVCVGERVEEKNLIGITQVKFVMGNNYEDMEKNLNDFLYESRYDKEILSIEHAMAYVAVTYKLRSKKSRSEKEWSLKCYQEQ